MIIKETTDFNLVYDIYDCSFPLEEKKDKSKIVEMINSRKYHLYILCKDNNILGFILLYSTNNEIALIDFLAVHPNFRSQGVGSFLLKEMMEKYKYLLLEVELNDGIEGSDTYRREAFYKKMGVEKIDVPYELPTPTSSLPMNLFILTKNQNLDYFIIKSFMKEAISFIHSDIDHTPMVINKYIDKF